MRRLLAASSLATLVACGGGGGDDGGTDDGLDSRTTIDGRVNRVATAATTLASGSAQLPQVSGIRVEAQHAGQTLDVTTTDIEGRFTLEFAGGGRVELVFATDNVVLTLALDVLPGSVVSLVVELHIDEQEVIVIEEPIVRGDPIRCASGDLTIFDETLDLLIDGEGDDCVRTEGNCVLDITVRSLTLVGCERCIDAHGGSDVSITAFPGGVKCEAREDGIRAAGNALVDVEAAEDVEIDALGGHGIRAEGTAAVSLASDDTCEIAGDENAVRVNGAAVVDLEDCEDLVLIGDVDDRNDDGEDDDDDEDEDNGEDDG